MMWLRAAAALVSLWLIGACTLRVAGVRAQPGPQRIAGDIAAGVAVLGTLGMFMIAVGLHVSLTVCYVLLAVLVVAALRRRDSMMPVTRHPLDRPTKALLLCGCAVVLAIGVTALRDRLWWDGWAIWAFKARVLFMDGTLSRAFLESDGGYAFTHTDYPLAVPLVGWWIYRHAGVAAAPLASFVGAVWFALLSLLLWGSLREHTSARVAALAALGMAAFWPMAFYATGGTADVVMGVSLLGAVIELERGITRADQAALVRCGVFLTLGILSKNEGVAIAAVALLVFLGVVLRGGEWRFTRVLPFALPFVALVPWWVLSTLLDVREPAVSWSMLEQLPARVPVFVARLARLGFSASWLPLPFVALIGIIAAARQRVPGLTAGWFVLAGYFAVICLVYLLTPQDMTWLLTTSLPRVLSVFVPALVYLSVRSAAAGEMSPAAPPIAVAIA